MLLYLSSFRPIHKDRTNAPNIFAKMNKGKLSSANLITGFNSVPKPHHIQTIVSITSRAFKRLKIISLFFIGYLLVTRTSCVNREIKSDCCIFIDNNLGCSIISVAANFDTTSTATVAIITTPHINGRTSGYRYARRKT